MCDQEVVRGHLRGHEARLVRDLDAIVGAAIRLNLADEVDGFDAMSADERVAALEALAAAREPLGGRARATSALPAHEPRRPAGRAVKGNQSRAELLNLNSGLSPTKAT